MLLHTQLYIALKLNDIDSINNIYDTLNSNKELFVPNEINNYIKLFNILLNNKDQILKKLQ